MMFTRGIPDFLYGVVAYFTNPDMWWLHPAIYDDPGRAAGA